jgi:DNA-binding beta-propeller fold protein YncE
MKWITKEKIGIWLLLCGVFSGCNGQKPFGTDELTLSKTIPMSGVQGRIDHLDVNLKDGIAYVAALGNNTLEVVDLVKGKVIHSIDGLDEPQGVGYIPQTREVFVANGGTGDCFFFNTHTFEKMATVHLGSDADDVRYDSVEEKIYVGYGSGGIAIIDAVSRTQVGDIRLPTHPESFQLDKGLHLLFVNLPDASVVGVVDLGRSQLVNKWEDATASANFPMAVDTVFHRVMVGYRHPARLLVYDGRSGKVLGSEKMTGDADDLYYDEASGNILVSGGAGAVSIFKASADGIYKQSANILTRSGARTSLLVPGWRMLLVAARAASGGPAELLLYRLPTL